MRIRTSLQDARGVESLLGGHRDVLLDVPTPRFFMAVRFVGDTLHEFSRVFACPFRPLPTRKIAEQASIVIAKLRVSTIPTVMPEAELSRRRPSRSPSPARYHREQDPRGTEAGRA
jgi:hypothetical protein